MSVCEYDLELIHLDRYVMCRHKLKTFVHVLKQHIKFMCSAAMSSTCMFVSLVGYAKEKEYWKNKNILDREKNMKSWSPINYSGTYNEGKQKGSAILT